LVANSFKGRLFIKKYQLLKNTKPKEELNEDEEEKRVRGFFSGNYVDFVG